MQYPVETIAGGRRFSRLLKSGLVALGVLALGALSAPAFAQKPDKPDPKKSPPSFSNKPGVTPGKQTSGAPSTKVVPQQDVADAVLAGALNELFEQTDEHFHEGEYNHCINLYAIIVQGDPHNVEAYANSAFLLWSSMRNTEAISVLKQGIAANPNTYYMYDELGAHYLIHLRDAKSALPYCEQAVKFKSPFTTWHNLAFCYEKTGQWTKAVAAWEKAAEFQDVDPGVHSRTLQLLQRARGEAAKHK